MKNHDIEGTASVLKGTNPLLSKFTRYLAIDEKRTLREVEALLHHQCQIIL